MNEKDYKNDLSKQVHFLNEVIGKLEKENDSKIETISIQKRYIATLEDKIEDLKEQLAKADNNKIRAYDLTNLDHNISAYLYPRLEKYETLCQGFPPSFDSLEAWRESVHKMYEAFKFYYEHSFDEDVQENKDYLEGKELFFKYFEHLWW